MNFAALKARLRRSVKNPGEEDVPDTDLGENINEGYRDLASRYAYHQTRKRCTFVTVVGQDRYQLPPDLASVLHLRDNTHGKKIWKGGDRTATVKSIYEVRWWPKKYVRYRNYVQLLPTPDGEYVIEVYYIAIPALLTLAEDVPVLPETWHIGIMMRAKWYYFIDRGDSAQATEALNNYTIWLSDKPSEIEEESVDIDSSVEVPTSANPRTGASPSGFDDGTWDFKD